MNSIEELLWAYIDGNCTLAEHTAISARIESDEAYRLKYYELLKLNQEFKAMELDAPPMAFTCNVMETIRAEAAQKPLKAVINRKIIMGITAFFTVTIMLLLMYTLSKINWPVAGSTSGNGFLLTLPDVGAFITKPVKEGFLFFDLVLALFLADKFFRNRTHLKQI